MFASVSFLCSLLPEITCGNICLENVCVCLIAAFNLNTSTTKIPVRFLSFQTGSHRD
ncbi:hypothetical protein KC19_2G233200 [Ceratodon purpureus]|uniref:Uncharacterized protein n=1 Tax=Ceratodon purpureus TaxID=3225 RepID=A0A8T0IX55_CERPU|nr:hypothetical protein KC19_2G233200 [Ceratodon purpureus]